MAFKTSFQNISSALYIFILYGALLHFPESHGTYLCFIGIGWYLSDILHSKEFGVFLVGQLLQLVSWLLMATLKKGTWVHHSFEGC